MWWLWQISDVIIYCDQTIPMFLQGFLKLLLNCQLSPSYRLEAVFDTNIDISNNKFRVGVSSHHSHTDEFNSTASLIKISRLSQVILLEPRWWGCRSPWCSACNFESLGLWSSQWGRRPFNKFSQKNSSQKFYPLWAVVEGWHVENHLHSIKQAEQRLFHFPRILNKYIAYSI